MKHILVMGVRDEKLVQQLFSIDASCTLQEAVKRCQSYQATKSVTSAIWAPPTALRGVVKYKKG